MPNPSSQPRNTPEDEDVEGHGGGVKRPQVRSDDDVEGHGGGVKRPQADPGDEDVEGHGMEMRFRSPGSTGE
jgi:hypothetical protein